MTEGELRALTFGFRAARAVMAGVALGVFDALAEAPGTAEALAARCGLDPRGAAALLEALAATGVVEREAEGYRAGPAALRGLAAEGETTRRHVVLHDLWHWGLWARLEESVRTGRPVADRSGDPFFSDTAVLAAFFPNLARAMAETSREEARLLSGALALRGDERVLDLGGGAGQHALALARAHPRLLARVFDLPPVAGEAERAAKEAGLAERVGFLAGDFRSDPLDPEGEGYDLVLVARVLMGLPEVDAGALLARAREACRPGGRVAVLEFARDEGGGIVPALLDLDMLLLTGGRVRTPDELAALLRAAGLAPEAPRRLAARSLLVEARS